VNSDDVQQLANEYFRKRYGRSVGVIHTTGDFEAGEKDQLTHLRIPAWDRIPAGWVKRSENMDSLFLVPESDEAKAMLERFNKMITSAQGWPLDEPGPIEPSRYNEVWRARRILPNYFQEQEQ
jgi:hypothetical protein